MNHSQQLALPFVLMVATLVLANLLESYNEILPFMPFGLDLAQWMTWGTTIYTLTFLINDLTNRFYGTEQTTRLILASFPVGLLLAAMFVSWRLALASGLAFLIAQQIDNKVFDRLRHWRWWQAPLISSALASIADSVVFYAIGFWGAVGNGVYFGVSAPLWVGWVLGNIVFKFFLVAILLLPDRVFLQRIVSRQSADAP